jgi:hypothetical protein
MESDNKMAILPPKRYFTKSYPQGIIPEKRPAVLPGIEPRNAGWKAASGAPVVLQGVFIQPVAAVARYLRG